MESSGRFESGDLKLIVPNACPKLVIPFKNGLSACSEEWHHVSVENRITFIGISDIPACVDFQHDGAAGSITVEFKPAGAYRFTGLNWHQVKNKIFDYDDVAGTAARAFGEKLANESSIPRKVELIQQFLISLLQQLQEDPIFDFCVQKIMQYKGKLEVRSLERLTGYSARWLNMKFHSRIGISPKNLSSIIRFQQYYDSVISNSELFFMEKQFYEYFHDQSHFIKDFKRFTGHAPGSLSKLNNNYDTVFYKG